MRPTAVRLFLGGAIARNTLLTCLVLSVRVAALAVQMWLVARLLGPAHFSQYVAIGALAVILGAFSSFGTHLLVLRDAARGDASQMLAQALGTWVCLSPCLFVAYLTVCHVLGVTELLWLVLGFGVAEFFLQPVLNLMAMLRQGRGQVTLAQNWLLVPLALRAFWVLLLWQSEPDDLPLLLGLGYAASTALSVCWLWLRREVHLPRWQDWRLLKGAQWKEAGSFALLGLTNSGQAEVDKLLAVRLLAAGPAGVYAAASRVVSALILPVVSLMLSALPRLFARPEWDVRLQLHLFVAAGGYAVLAGALLWLGAPWVARAFGPGYESMEQGLRVLVWAVPAQSLRMVVLNVLMTKGNALLRILVELAGIAALIIGASLLAVMKIQHMLPWAVVVAEWITMVMGVVLLYRQRERLGQSS